MPFLKVDFHTHTAEDPSEHIRYSGKELIDRAASLGFDAIAVTNHDRVTHTPSLEAHARSRGVLLIPGIEAQVENSHVLLINPGFDPSTPPTSFSDLLSARGPDTLVIAPHPFFPGSKSLKKDFVSHLELFDAVEVCQYHSLVLDINRKAVRLAVRQGLPLVGSSDCHFLWQFGFSYSWVESDKNIPSIIRAVKDGRVEVHSPPRSVFFMLRSAFHFFAQDRHKTTSFV